MGDGMDDETPAGRSEEFAGGASGGGQHIHVATAMPDQQQADPSFQPASVLLAANTYSGAGNGSSDATLSLSDPYGKAMRDTLKQSGGGAEQEQA